MSDEKIKKSEQSLPDLEPKHDKTKIEKSIETFSKKPIKEGYQPTDELDTSNPPTDRVDEDKE